uniref:Uncharacterized protein n=1 Tax=Rhizophora mucronata TaxID=61149 RepID=A0A2P2Q0Q0_RHIMU
MTNQSPKTPPLSILSN